VIEILRILLLFLFLQSIISRKSITSIIKEAKMERDKFVGISKVGEKGQIVIPKEARDMFDIKPGDSIIVLCDKEKGIALLKADAIEDLTDKVFPKGGNK
jgi:AbrB family looped-hinge helix DNA binding protein